MVEYNTDKFGLTRKGSYVHNIMGSKITEYFEGYWFTGEDKIGLHKHVDGDSQTVLLSPFGHKGKTNGRQVTVTFEDDTWKSKSDKDFFVVNGQAYSGLSVGELDIMLQIEDIVGNELSEDEKSGIFGYGEKIDVDIPKSEYDLCDKFNSIRSDLNNIDDVRVDGVGLSYHDSIGHGEVDLMRSIDYRLVCQEDYLKVHITPCKNVDDLEDKKELNGHLMVKITQDRERYEKEQQHAASEYENSIKSKSFLRKFTSPRKTRQKRQWTEGELAPIIDKIKDTVAARLME